MAKILVADDDLFYRKMIESFLAEDGHEVISVSDGLEAFGRWRQEDPPFDCVILDVYMSGMFGVDVLEEMRTDAFVEPVNTPVVIMTSDDSVATELEARSKGASAFLVKPFAKEELQSVVRALLGRREPKRSNSLY